MRKKIAVATMLLVFIVSILPMALAVNTVKAASDPFLEVKPNSYITNQLEPFNVAVWLNSITADKKLISIQFSLEYNSTLLEVQNIVEGPFLAQFNQTSTPPYTFFVPTWNNTEGKAIVGIMILPNPIDPLYTVFPDGSGALATITFKGIYPTDGLYTTYSCALELKDIILLDEQLNAISYLSPVNGYYEITRTLLGDVDGNGRVDIADLSKAALAYGAYGPDGPNHQYPGIPASQRWEPWGPRVDFDNNNLVDIHDLLIIAKNFGKTAQ